MVLPTNHDLPTGFAAGQLTIQSWGRSALGAAVLLAAFTGLFVLGGWGAIGDPPKPFAPAEGFFVSGVQLQTAVLILLGFGLVLKGWDLDTFLDAGAALLWRIAVVAALLSMLIVFLWASARFLFGISFFPAQGLPLSRSETWWIELAMALFGVALAGAIPILLRWGGHVSIDALAPVIGQQAGRLIAGAGALFLATPFGWLLLTKGTVFAARAWDQGESSANFGIEFVFLVKTLVPLLGFLVVVFALASLRLRDRSADE